MIRSCALPLFARRLGRATQCDTLQLRGDDPPPLPPVKLTIHPAAAARPSLKYQLLPEFNTRIRGNAAVYYGKVTAEALGFFGNRELLDKIDELARGAARSTAQNDEACHHLERRLSEARHGRRAANRATGSCRFTKRTTIAILLPEVQQTRQFARILATTARIHIARGEFDDGTAHAAIRLCTGAQRGRRGNDNQRFGEHCHQWHAL